MNPDLTLTPRQFCDKFNACSEGRAFALKHKTMRTVWDKCPNPQWMLWICARLNIKLDPKAARLFACWCVRHTPLSDGRTTWDLLTDDRSRNAVVVAERFANGQATDTELAATGAAARAAAWAARDVARAAWIARDVAREAAGDAAWAAAEAAGDAAWAARDVARAAGDAARDVAREAARDVARAAAEAAGDAAWAAAEAAGDAAWAAWEAAWEAAWAAAGAAGDAAWAARDVARAAGDAARAAQAQEIRRTMPNPFAPAKKKAKK